MLSPGTKLGPHEIVAAIGAGGMGEVYRARDTKLGREVALKVLPEAFAADAERMGRFEREAKVLASLNHPNIASIYGFEDSSGAGTPARALVMELVEGPTLDERIAKGAIPIDEALPIAKQICEGLEYAHERGIIHRDLKPANVKITPDGAVKILDFGLAKALAGEAVASDPSSSPTLSHLATQAGIILGTAAYMSPEQAKGKPVDRRADIWAFGCVLFEMLTRKHAFDGETVTDVLAALVMREPDWSLLPASTPQVLRSLIQRCLRKDPRQRLQSIGDARVALEEQLGGLAGSGAETGLPRPRRDRDVKSPLHWAPWAMTVLVVIVGVFFALAYFRIASRPRRSIQAFIPPPENTVFHFVSGEGGPVSISPDGTELVFAATGKDGKDALWVRRVDDLDAVRLAGTDGATYPFWSPDSQTISFFADGKLKKIPAGGGSPLSIGDAPAGRGGAWNREGVIIFAPEVLSRIYRIPAGGGAATAITQLPESVGTASDRWPFFLPDGKHFLYLRADPGAPQNDVLMVGSLNGGTQVSLLATHANAAYASGYLLYLRGSTLLAQPFDADALKFTGEAKGVAENIQVDGIYFRGMFSVSENGVLTYEASQIQAGSQLAWFERSGKQVGTVGDLTGQSHPAISPDGKEVAVSVHDPSTGWGIWTYDLARGVRTRLTGCPVCLGPLWSPDGTQIVFSAPSGQGTFDLYEKPSDGSGDAKVLLRLDQRAKAATSWSPDGRYIAYQARSGAKRLWGVWILPMFKDRKPFPYLAGDFNGTAAQFSPDGRWLAYVSDETGLNQVYVVPFPKPDAKWQISASGGSDPRWSSDGGEIFYVAPDSKLVAVGVRENGGKLEVSSGEALFAANLLAGTLLHLREFDVARDGERFLINEEVSGGSPAPLTLVVNWPELLKKQ